MITALVSLMMEPKLSEFDLRERDWRNGAIVYQVFVDRFAPSDHLEAKRKHYPAPDAIKKWTDEPQSGKFLKEVGFYSHELEFWGGDLQSLIGKFDHITKLGADVLYLLPIHLARTNHKYDAINYKKVDPQYGTTLELNRLIKLAHKQKVKVMLDGVFNHIGQNSQYFLKAKSDTKSPYREWFTFGDNYPNGYKSFSGVASLPSLRLENPKVRNFLWQSKDSVVQHYLREGIDGWRLDVAFDLGPEYLESITRTVHKVRPGAAVVGEISGYPSEWNLAVDGVYNFTPYQILRGMLANTISGGRAGAMLNHMVEDAGIGSLLKSWLIMDNHDTSRLATELPDFEDRKLAQLMTFTLPGCPLIYYGTELGMSGKGDPGSRGPMQWNLLNKNNKDFSWIKKLIQIRKRNGALRYGNHRTLDTEKTLAFSRVTDKLFESVIVVINPLNQKVEETFSTRMGRIMSWGPFVDLIGGTKVRSVNGMMTVTLGAKSGMILVPEKLDLGGYSPYDRIGK